MSRTVGTTARGVRTPIIREGDDLVSIVVDSLLECAEAEKIAFQDMDVIGVTEAVVARAQGNYAHTDQIAADVKEKFPDGEIGLIWPIFSRNRFSICFKGICQAAKKIYLQMGFPSDEVGNQLIDENTLEESGLNPYVDVLTEADFRARFGERKHEFTGVDYISFYRSLAEEAGAEIEIILSDNRLAILDYTQNILCCDIHSRERTAAALKKAGAKSVYLLSDILNKSVDGSGYNPDYGLLGTNKATEETVKMFPRDCHAFVVEVQRRLIEKTGKQIEVMVYGDGAFKDPVGKIWELADPVVSPAYTDGLFGTPNEVKLKYLADNDFAGLTGDALKSAIEDYISEKSANLKGSMAAQGTTPRRLTDLIGSLCDLTSGSGDKGTPVIWIQGYFDNFANA